LRGILIMGCGRSKVYHMPDLVSIPTVDHGQSEMWDLIVDLYRSLLSERGHQLVKHAITLKVRQDPTSPVMLRALKRFIKSHKQCKYPY
jgi:hypothetical protein